MAEEASSRAQRGFVLILPSGTTRARKAYEFFYIKLQS